MTAFTGGVGDVLIGAVATLMEYHGLSKVSHLKDKLVADIRAVDPSSLQRGDNALVMAIEQIPAVFTPVRV